MLIRKLQSPPSKLPELHKSSGGTGGSDPSEDDPSVDSDPPSEDPPDVESPSVDSDPPSVDPPDVDGGGVGSIMAGQIATPSGLGELCQPIVQVQSVILVAPGGAFEWSGHARSCPSPLQYLSAGHMAHEPLDP